MSVVSMTRLNIYLFVSGFQVTNPLLVLFWKPTSKPITLTILWRKFAEVRTLRPITHPTTMAGSLWYFRTLQQSRHAITCEIKIPSPAMFIYTAVYASNESSERTDLWVELLNTHQTFSLNSTPRMLGGDFNQILHPAEHSSTTVSSLSPDMIQFKDCLSQMGMLDLRFQGSFFSWTNRYPEAPIAKKLDRLLINSQILTLYPDCSTFFLPSLTSDHAPCLLNLAYRIPSCGTCPFKFFNYLSKHPCFHQVVLDSWT